MALVKAATASAGRPQASSVWPRVRCSIAGLAVHPEPEFGASARADPPRTTIVTGAVVAGGIQPGVDHGLGLVLPRRRSSRRGS